jgi:hypothetical protein
VPCRWTIDDLTAKFQRLCRDLTAHASGGIDASSSGTSPSTTSTTGEISLILGTHGTPGFDK